MAPLSYKRKRVDNSDIEEERITNYEAAWREIDQSLTELSTLIDSWNLKLENWCLSFNIWKDALLIRTGKSKNCIKEKESNQIRCNSKMADNGGLRERLRDDYQQPHFLSRASSYNAATNFEAVKMEMEEFLARANSFLKQVLDHLKHSLIVCREKIESDMNLISKMLDKAHSSPASVHTIPTSK